MLKTLLIIVLLVFLGTLLMADNEKPAEETLMKPRFEKRESFMVMGIEAADAMEGNKMMELWTQFMEIRVSIPDPVSKVEYGITYYGKDYDPETMKGYNYFVGMEVASLDKLPEGLLGHLVPGGYYAVFEHKGPIGKIGNTYSYIFSQWLKDSGHKPEMQDVFEVYDERFSYDSDDSILEIWIPIEP